PPFVGDLDGVLAALKDPAQKGTALHWLKAADPNQPRRDEVARALEEMLAAELQPQFPNHAYFDAYFRWATAVNVPGLLRMVEDATFTVWHTARRQNAMKTLAQLKAAQGAPAIARRLTDHFDRGTAVAALKDMGPVAEAAVVPYLGSPDGNARVEACNV